VATNPDAVTAKRTLTGVVATVVRTASGILIPTIPRDVKVQKLLREKDY